MIKRARANPRWEAQPGSQRLFLSAVRSGIFEVLYEGTRGPGKTAAMLMDFAQFVKKGYGASWRGVIFRRTHPELADVISKSKDVFFDAFPGSTYNESKFQWEWPTGEMLLFRHFMKPDDYWSYHGHEYPFIGWEELCTWPTLDGYKRMMSCCRSSNADVPRMYRATANPYGPGHNAVKKRFQLPAMQNQIILRPIDTETGKQEPSRMAVHGYLDENKVLLKADPDYITRLHAAARNPAELKAWIDGDWNIVAGGMFDDLWDPKHHVVPQFEVPPSWRIDRSFDWGGSSPFSVGWWAESDGTDLFVNGQWRSTVRGDLYRIGEWYGCRPGRDNEGLNLLATEIAAGIVTRELAMRIHDRCQPGAADSAIYTVENGNGVADDMAKPVRLGERVYPGVRFIPADKRPYSRVPGWQKVREYLAGAIKLEGRPREKPGLFFCIQCKDAINQIPVLPREPKDMDDVDTKSEDHIADEVRYRVRAAGFVSGQSEVIGAY